MAAPRQHALVTGATGGIGRGICLALIAQAQREGHALRAFVALEDEVRRLGLSGIALHVFGHNTGAQALYAKLGFHPTNISLYKPVAAAGA